MSDPRSKSASIPSWQQRPDPGATPADQSPASSSPSSGDAPASTPTTRQELVDQASKFLQDGSIRDAPTDRKISFLESKGLNSDEIQQLLGVARNPEASSTSSDPAENKSQQESSSASTSSATSASSLSSSVTAPSSSTAMSQPSSTSSASSASRDVPPIITYPEFLFQPSKPPPLVTLNRVLYTIYGAAGLGASIYGASEYLVKPMLASLTSARHELATTAQENLQKLNEKLEQNVSVIPPQLTSRKTSPDDDEEEFKDDNDSVTSDPTELFHRDMGTQTTPDVSPAPEITTTTGNPLEAPVEAVNHHMSRLNLIQSQLKEIADLEKDSGTYDDSMRSRLTDFHHYLDGLIYATPTYTTAGYGGFGGSSSSGLFSNTSSGLDSSSAGVGKGEDEAIASFKAEIRGVKGALLSARNFPASRGGRLGGAPAGVR